MFRSRKRMLLIAVGIVVVAAAAVAGLYYRRQTTWVASPPYHRTSTAPARTLVVVYSCTGNTLAAAKEAARYLDADLLQIRAPQYSLDWSGQRLAARHADEELTTTPIEHEPVDLSRYELIVLCSPTWWYRPAVPMWSFVEQHDFAGRPVFLLMTGNSRRKPEHTEKFRRLVERQHGRLLDTCFVRRGRIYWQKTPAEVHTEVREVLEARRKLWPVRLDGEPSEANP